MKDSVRHTPVLLQGRRSKKLRGSSKASLVETHIQKEKVGESLDRWVGWGSAWEYGATQELQRARRKPSHGKLRGFIDWGSYEVDWVVKSALTPSPQCCFCVVQKESADIMEVWQLSCQSVPPQGLEIPKIPAGPSQGSSLTPLWQNSLCYFESGNKHLEVAKEACLLSHL